MRLRTAIVLGLALSVASCGAGSGSGSSAGASAGAGSGTGPGTGTGTGTAPAAGAFEEFARLRAAIAGLSAADQRSQLAAVISSRAASEEGLPLRDGTRAAFVFEGSPGGAAPALAGSWNGWSTSATPLSRIGATDAFFVEVALPRADRYEYKLVLGGSDWRSDSLNRKFSYEFGNSVLNLAGSGKSHLEAHRAVRSTALGNARDVIVYLPPGYLDGGAAAAERHPVVYMHDGQNVFDPGAFFGGWDVANAVDALIATGATKKLIVVGIHNTPDRMDEYTHVPDDLSSSCNGSGRVGGRAPEYADFLVNELKPAIDARYRTLAAREHTAILGSSLGGLVAIWTAFEYPHVFKNAGGMSSTFGWGRSCPSANPRMVDLATARGKLDLRIYIDSGGSALTNPPSGDNWGVTDEMRRLLVSQGYGADLQYFWAQNGQHNEAAWRARVDRPLRFWFPR